MLAQDTFFANYKLLKTWYVGTAALLCRFITKDLALKRERQGGKAALQALTRCPLANAVQADGTIASSSNGHSSNGHSSGTYLDPPEGYVWMQRNSLTHHRANVLQQAAAAAAE